ncbi:MAG: alpha-amylase family glycosyl hydrolase, partial [Cyanobacteriota bacterium]
MLHWAYDSIFYHIYPLGFCNAPYGNDFHSQPVNRLECINSWVDHMANMGVNALYLGPVFESTAHGYDTADYFQVDRRLGTNEDLARLINNLHNAGIKVILDGVFNHVGRNFWAFQDVLKHGRNSMYCDWIHGLDFNRSNCYNDPFYYSGWQGHYNLVK